MMKINCLACGHNVDLDEIYSDYDGLVKCYACSALLDIRTEDGQIKAVRFVTIARGLPESEEDFEVLRTADARALTNVSGL